MSASERRIEELEVENRRLSHLLKKTMRAGGTMEFESGVNPEGEAFVQIRWDENAAQMDPEEARKQAVILMRVADAAELDAALVKLLTTKGLRGEHPLTVYQASGFLGLVREHRHGDRERSA